MFLRIHFHPSLDFFFSMCKNLKIILKRVFYYLFLRFRFKCFHGENLITTDSQSTETLILLWFKEGHVTNMNATAAEKQTETFTFF